MIIEECTDIEQLKSLGEHWISELNADEFGLDVDIGVIKADLESWNKGEGVVYVAKEGDTIIGMIAVFAVPSYLGNQKMALEKYWYTIDGSHFAGPRLYIEAVKWARDHGCSHIITCGSNMASDKHDAICRFMEHTGAKHFETSYIYHIGDE